MKEVIYMKLSTAREDVFIVFLSFWITILLTRYWSFQYFSVFNEYPVLYVFNVPIHHFFVGLILVSLVFFAKLVTNKFSLLGLLCLGIGLGLIADEFWLLATGNFTIDNVYWAVQNLAALIVFGLISFGIIRIMDQRKESLLNENGVLTHKNPKNPLVSVVVPALNEEKFITNNLLSLVRQDFKNFEIIVVDNNSTDKTAEIAKKFGVTVIYNAEKGVGAARQAGFAIAKGKIIATTDADNILPPDWLTRIVHEFEKDEKLVAFGGLFRLYSGPLSARIAVRYLTYPVFKFDKLMSSKWSLIAQNMAVSKKAFQKVGGFKHLQIGEDADLAQRLSEIGKVYLDPEFLVYASGRRARHGALSGAMAYAPNGFSRMFLKQHRFDKLPTVRQEQSILTKLSFIPLLISIVYLIVLFSSMNTTLSDARKELVSKTTTNISRIKLEELASELAPPPSSSWSGILRQSTRLPFIQND